MREFNLIDEPWIPVRDLAGTRKETGIREVLLTADKLAAIEDPSPLVTAALYRFLLAVLYRALKGPCDIDEAKQLFRDGLPAEKIEGYLTEWRDRFWLFDEKYPFGQNPEFQPKNWRTWPSLAVENNADNAKVLFDHTNVEDSGYINNAVAARLILAINMFAVSAGKSELLHTGTGPSAGSAIIIPIGNNLLDTLLFCLVPQNREIFIHDIPSWERGPETLEYLKTPIQVMDKKTGKPKDRAPERPANGFVDLYTWQSRTIRLRATMNGRISELGLASGIGYSDTGVMLRDPMVAHVLTERKVEGSKEKEKVVVPIHLQDRGIWRDFDSLLPDDTHFAPSVVESSVALTSRAQHRRPRSVMVLGQRYHPPRPNLDYWRMERFVLPEAIVGDHCIRHDIRTILECAEATGTALESACSTYAEDVLRHGNRQIEQKDVHNFVAQLPCIPHYWSTLESRFHEVLRDYTLEKDPDDIHRQWLVAVRGALSSAWDLHRASIDGADAWAIRAFVKADGIIGRKITELNRDIQALKEEP